MNGPIPATRPLRRNGRGAILQSDELSGGRYVRCAVARLWEIGHLQRWPGLSIMAPYAYALAPRLQFPDHPLVGHVQT
jgi:hypothetical protein